MLQAGTGRARMRWAGRRAGNRVGLGLAAEAAEMGIRLDRPAAFAAEHGSRSWGSVRRRQSGPIIGPAFGRIPEFKSGVTKGPTVPLDW